MKFSKVVGQIEERNRGHNERFEFYKNKNDELYVKPSGSNVELTFKKWVQQDKTRLKAANMLINKSLNINKKLDYDSIYRSLTTIFYMKDEVYDMTILKDSDTGEIEDVVVSDKRELHSAARDAKTKSMLNSLKSM